MWWAGDVSGRYRKLVATRVLDSVAANAADGPIWATEPSRIGDSAEEI
jgi:hypothetical protein